MLTKNERTQLLRKLNNLKAAIEECLADEDHPAQTLWARFALLQHYIEKELS